MKQALLKQSYRDYFLFVLGINSGLRISDILKLRVCDIRDKKHLELKEEKTGKTKKLLINDNLRSETAKYCCYMDDNDYLFTSLIGRKTQPIGRITAYIILNKAATKVGLEKIGTHTLRKTFGYHMYKKTKDVALLQQIFGHSSPSVTLRYIGINQDILDSYVYDFSL